MSDNMSDRNIIAKTQAETAKLNAETAKLEAEARKLAAEQLKLIAEGLKLNRDRIIAPMTAIGLFVGSAIGAAAIVIRLLWF